MRFVGRPLNNALPPSSWIMVLKVWITPRYFASDAVSSGICVWVCSRVRMTSCGYVTVLATIFDTADAINIPRLLTPFELLTNIVPCPCSKEDHNEGEIDRK